MQRKQQLIFTAMILAGIGFFVAAGLIGRTDPPDAALRIPGIEGLIPERGDEVLQQQRVGIDLEPGYVVRSMTISSDARCTTPVEVVDFGRYTEGLNLFIYQPDEGKPVTQLSPDSNCARVIFEDLQRPGELLDVEWSFTVN
ncbi:MAG: hypothetical protein DHS20C19_05700 [Acidimicrobiales bacterium]|nr:MAG: hypothetical protein DHS20C19_05700 [Acidimicrobiales bacterium]